MHSLKLVLAAVCLAIGFQEATAALGGGTCTIPASGSPGASTLCTASANGFCLIDHLAATGSPVTAVNFDGVCVCYYGYSGTNCGTVDSTATTSTSSTTSSNNNNAIAALVLGGLGAYYLSQLGSGQNALGIGSGSPQSLQESLYLQQAGLGK